MSIEQGMLEEQVRGLVEQRFRVAATFGQTPRGAERLAHNRRRFVVRDGSIGELLQPVGDPVDQIVAR